jgi:Zn-finger nucleic acid-binding protein
VYLEKPMNCPTCDAAMRQEGNRPHFRCPNCGAFHFPQETGDGVLAVGEPVGAACPVCRLPLQSAVVEDETVCYCDRCRGFLAPIPAFARAVGRRRARRGPDEQQPGPFDQAELLRELHCPNCDDRMDAHPYAGGGAAVVDTCEGCGLIWLDAGELVVIGRYVPRTHHIDPVHRLPGAGLGSANGMLSLLFWEPHTRPLDWDDV